MPFVYWSRTEARSRDIWQSTASVWLHFENIKQDCELGKGKYPSCTVPFNTQTFTYVRNISSRPFERYDMPDGTNFRTLEMNQIRQFWPVKSSNTSPRWQWILSPAPNYTTIMRLLFQLNREAGLPRTWIRRSNKSLEELTARGINRESHYITIQAISDSRSDRILMVWYIW